MSLLPSRAALRWAAIVAGPLLAVVTYLLLPASPQGLSHAGRGTAAVGVWMAVWWLTEAIPIAATALLPIAVLPLIGARPIDATTRPYAHSLIFLFMGGFVVALSMERWGLHRRVALRTLQLVGTRPRHVVGGFMLVTAALSMWCSNTATSVMMLPIVLSVIDRVAHESAQAPPSETGVLPPEGRNFALCLLLGVAYGASIGGIGTLVGTPPNLFLASYVRDHLGTEISFARWLAVGVPVVAIMLPLTWLLLTRMIYPIRLGEIPGGRKLLREQSKELGPLVPGEIATLVVFVTMAGLWLFRPLLEDLQLGGGRPFSGLTDAGIAMAAALALFVIPVDRREWTFAMSWQWAARIPWGILLLFGGGLSLAGALEANGVTGFLGQQVRALHGVPPLVTVLAISTLVVFLTEVTSNTATTAAFVPILASVAPVLELAPYTLIVPATLSASCAFMMPVATPPNAVVFGSGYITVPQMARAGLWLNALAIGVLTALTWTVVLPVLGVR